MRRGLRGHALGAGERCSKAAANVTTQRPLAKKKSVHARTRAAHESRTRQPTTTTRQELVGNTMDPHFSRKTKSWPKSRFQFVYSELGVLWYFCLSGTVFALRRGLGRLPETSRNIFFFDASSDPETTQRLFLRSWGCQIRRFLFFRLGPAREMDFLIWVTRNFFHCNLDFVFILRKFPDCFFFAPPDGPLCFDFFVAKTCDEISSCFSQQSCAQYSSF